MLRPILADIDRTNWCLDPNSFARSITPSTRAVIVSHLHGGIADMEAIVETARSYGIKVIEDICQCPGAKRNGRCLGTWGDVCALSFGGSKLLSAGRGGAIATQDEANWQRAKIYCERGNDAYPLSELQAAVLLPQLEALSQHGEMRRNRFLQLANRLAGSSHVQTQAMESADMPDFYKVPLLVNFDQIEPQQNNN